MSEQWDDARREAHSIAMKAAHAAKKAAKAAPKKPAKKKPVKRRKKRAQSIPLHAIPAKKKPVKKTVKPKVTKATVEGRNTNEVAIELIRMALKLLAD